VEWLGQDPLPDVDECVQRILTGDPES